MSKETGEDSKDVHILRQSVDVLRKDLRQALHINRILCSALLQCGHVGITSILKDNYSVSVCCRKRDNRVVVILPIKSILTDVSSTNIQFFYDLTNASYPIYLCSSWTVAIVPNHELSKEPYHSPYPDMAYFHRDNIRLQTDDGKQLQTFEVEGEFMGAEVSCKILITTRNTHVARNKVRVARPKQCVYLTSFSLIIHVQEYISRLQEASTL